jgi:5-methylcytosine-specific restriction endonuclease McrA
MKRKNRPVGNCFYCDEPISRAKKTKDHLLPKSRHGSDQPYNLVDCCKPCNQLKGMLTLEEFRVVIAFRNGLIPPSKMKFPGEIRKELLKK